MKNLYILTFVSKDQPGIVAKAAKVLLERGFNIKDSSSTRLSGVFAMILMVEHEESFEPDTVSSWFGELTPAVHTVEEENKTPEGEERFLISVYGADKPGIVFTIADTLAQERINIVDLQTRISGVYVMVLEISLPLGFPDTWIKRVKDAAASIKTDISVRKLEVFEL
ncbi:MAG: transcriptional regulator [Deferribacteraceae bacterium]|nr:transcriptional regulator [Deferribacteraceae bacterium]